MMKISYTHITTMFLGFLAYLKTGQTCEINCPPGYTCVDTRSTCIYPPCEFFSSCMPLPSHPSMNSVQRHEVHHGRHRHRPSLFDNALLSDSPAFDNAAMARPGQCPVPIGNEPCITSCRSDGDCPTSEKCCSHECGSRCRAAVTEVEVKPGACPRRRRLSSYCREECVSDSDCPTVQKCCRTHCGSMCSDPCFYWLRPHQRSSRGTSILSKLPYICRV